MPFEKGHKLAKGRIKGSKNVATLLKEERRAMFDAEISQRWKEIISQLPPAYIADQYLGKAPDKVELVAEVTQKAILTDKQIEEINKIALDD
jgi:hypothetical protein